MHPDLCKPERSIGAQAWLCRWGNAGPLAPSPQGFFMPSSHPVTPIPYPTPKAKLTGVANLMFADSTWISVGVSFLRDETAFKLFLSQCYFLIFFCFPYVCSNLLSLGYGTFLWFCCYFCQGCCCSDSLYKELSWMITYVTVFRYLSGHTSNTYKCSSVPFQQIGVVGCLKAGQKSFLLCSANESELL